MAVILIGLRCVAVAGLALRPAHAPDGGGRIRDARECILESVIEDITIESTMCIIIM
jgi:hypothetical protein